MGQRAVCMLVAICCGAPASVGCFRSERADNGSGGSPDQAAPDVALADAGASDGARPSAAAPDAGPADASATGAAIVGLFEHALSGYCTCRRRDPCDDLWSDRFEDVSRACVVGVLDRAGDVRNCAMRGARELDACLQTDACDTCNTALLTEDTPLADLIERHCSRAQANAYLRALRAADGCRAP